MTLGLAAAISASTVGCASAQHANHNPAEASYGRALATQPAVVQTHSAGRPGHHLPWYANRNDARLSVDAGVKSATHKTSVRWTIDRQRIANGRVRDSYHTTTYLQRIVHSIE